MVRSSGFGENIKLAFRGIFTHKMRSFLTMLGIIIGIAAIIAIVSTIRGTNEQIKQNLIGAGTNSVTVCIKQNDWEYEFDYMSVPDGFYPVSDESMDQIRSLPGVKCAARYLSRKNSASVYCGSVTLDGCGVFGVESDYFNAAGLQLIKGRLFGEHDISSFSKVAVLDRSAAKALFSSDEPIGKTIEIGKEVFLVVGVIDTESSFRPSIESMEDYYTYVGNTSAKVYIPLADWPILFQFDEPESVIVRCKDTDSMTDVGRKTAEILNNALGIGEGKDGKSGESDIRYKADDLLEQAKQIQDLSKNISAGRRHRSYEYNARIRDRAHKGDRPQKGPGSEKESHPQSVPDGSGRAYQRRRDPRSCGWHRAGVCDTVHSTGTGGHKHSGDRRIGALLDRSGTYLRASALDTGIQTGSYRGT